MWQRGLLKQYYSEVTEILRRYIEHRYRQPALEETTEEILSGLRKADYPADLTPTTTTILHRADLVKFAKHQPGIPEHEEMLAVVYHIVDRTKETPMTPVASEHPKEGTDVAG